MRILARVSSILNCRAKLMGSFHGVEPGFFSWGVQIVMMHLGLSFHSGVARVTLSETAVRLVVQC